MPVALRLDEARSLFAAARTIFASLTALGAASSPEGARLAHGMMDLAADIDKTTDKREETE